MLKCLSILKIKLITVVFYSSIYTEKQWYGDFKVQLNFSHGKTNLCSVLISFYGNVNAVVKNQFQRQNQWQSKDIDFGKDNWWKTISSS